MKRIRPFIGTELIKAMIGIHCCGKSVMLELIERELTEFGVSPTQFVSINFEDKLDALVGRIGNDVLQKLLSETPKEQPKHKEKSL